MPTTPLQVVPDIDDQEPGTSDSQQLIPSTAIATQSGTLAAQPGTPVTPGTAMIVPGSSASPRLSEFEMKLCRANAETDTIIPKERKVVISRRRPSQLPIRHVNVDAQPLTPAEIRQLLPPTTR